MKPKCQCTITSIGTTEVYVITLAVGNGTEEDPCREVVEWWQGCKRLLREDPFEKLQRARPQHGASPK